MIVIKFFIFELQTLKMFLICSLFLPTSANFFALTMFHYGSYSGTTFLYNYLRLLRAEAPKWTKIKQLLSTFQPQIVPRLKQLRLKLTSQQSIFAAAEY